MRFQQPDAYQKSVRLTLGLLVLAWATQALLAQWGYGQTLVASARDWPVWPAETVSGEKFVPGTERFAAGATIEVRDHATIVGPDIKLKQIARWSDDDAGVFRPLADLTLFRFPDKVAFKKLSAADVRKVLRDAGVNLANINFRGSTVCTVARSDVRVDEKAALKAWLDGTPPEASTSPTVASNTPAEIKGTVPFSTDEMETAAISPQDQEKGTVPFLSDGGVRGNARVALAPSTPIESGLATLDGPGVGASKAPAEPVKALREILITDLCQRVGIPVTDVQISFAPGSEQAVNLLSPQFKFDVESSRSRALGNVAWSVTITPPAGASKRMMINAVARAWQDQLVVARPVSVGQTLQATDVQTKRALVEQVSPDPMLVAEQAVGQQAGRDLKPGQVLTSRVLEPVPLVRAGQFVTVSIVRGRVQLQTVGRAMGQGTFGQTVRVKNEGTKETFDVIVTGPQAGRVGAADDKPQPAETTVLAN